MLSGNEISFAKILAKHRSGKDTMLKKETTQHHCFPQKQVFFLRTRFMEKPGTELGAPASSERQ